jgi:8-oxo-dGTP diphosphatase
MKLPDAFFEPDELVAGTKGLVFVGDKVVVYRRDAKAPKFPLCIDLPGGKAEPGETPFETFQRETKEEFGLDITKDDVVYARRYESTIDRGKFGWYTVARLPAEAEKRIVFGDEGLEYYVMSPEEYLRRDDAWTTYQDRARDYLKTLI